MDKLHLEINTLKSVFNSNGHPNNFIKLCIKIFLDKLCAKNEFDSHKLQLVCVLLYTGKLSLDLRACLRRTMEKKILFFKLNVFRSSSRLGNLFGFEDFLDKKMLSGIVYGYTCNNFNVTYYGITYQHFFTIVSEHMETSILRGDVRFYQNEVTHNRNFAYQM